MPWALNLSGALWRKLKTDDLLSMKAFVFRQLTPFWLETRTLRVKHVNLLLLFIDAVFTLKLILHSFIFFKIVWVLYLRNFDCVSLIQTYVKSTLLNPCCLLIFYTHVNELWNITIFNWTISNRNVIFLQFALFLLRLTRTEFRLFVPLRVPSVLFANASLERWEPFMH